MPPNHKNRADQKKLKVTEKRCRTALSKTKVSSYDYTINPYTGCQHACVYCYSNFMRRFSGHLQDAWGSFADVKVNLLDVLRRELPRSKGGIVWFSSVCDPYQPLERKYRLTRGAIELILDYPKFSLSILTKNALILRDVDLLQHMKGRVDVGFTITTFDGKAQTLFEPLPSTFEERITAIGKLGEAGIDTWAFIAPMLPYVTEEKLEEGLTRLAKAGVKRLLTDRYNARGMIINQTLQAYKKWRPALNLEEVLRLLWNAMDYYRRLDERIAHAWKAAAPSAAHEAVF
jgi:DNA repair photolyase